MNTITITVKSVNIVKTGVKKDGMPYMLLNVVDENDKKYSTFDEEFLKAVGKTITINYEEKESGSNPRNGGKPYKNRLIVEPKKGAAPSGTQVWAEKLVAKVKELEARVKKLEDEYEVVDEPAEEERPSLDEEEIKPEDIPF